MQLGGYDMIYDGNDVIYFRWFFVKNFNKIGKIS